LVEHVFSGNHGFVRSVEPDGTYTVEFSGPLVNAGYHREELKPVAARPLAERITQGPYAVTDTYQGALTEKWHGMPHTVTGEGFSICLMFGDGTSNRGVTAANTELIAEAFSVTHETGRTPRQIAEDVKELRNALENMVDCQREDDKTAFFMRYDRSAAQARAVLAKTEPRKQP
jgi:hypothetical protein